MRILLVEIKKTSAFLLSVRVLAFSLVDDQVYLPVTHD